MYPTWSCSHSAPPLLFPGPMEGQAVPTEPCQGYALTPTIHPNPPPLHPFQPLPLQPWHSACQPQPYLLPALPRPSSPLSPRARGQSYREQSPDQVPAAQMQCQELRLRAWPSPFSPAVSSTPLPSALGPGSGSKRSENLEYLGPIYPWG